ncbi:tRNA (adenosine(37)-N6)-threonylcarbamoyltransferase complex ATPase subunit type 1 TsaE [Cryomorphaceae bacterium 1068]|nr:tRNA (adenosine(37)-N6)-threonylcarbamoyltransferase complex ATPase subunit type 1 TsaE [Cryomorphaceae bacterium 1068]
MTKYIARSLKDLPTIADQLITEAGEHRLFAFYGKMGAGKTTLINSILEVLGVEESGSSPTFSLVNEYQGRVGEPVYHFDFYRIENIDEVYDIGYEDYFFSTNYCFIEWPEKVEELLPEDVVKVQIRVEGGHREILLDVDN